MLSYLTRFNRNYADGVCRMKKYMELYQSLRERIESNVFPVGAKLPTEKELSAEFNISRQTVRQAFDLLRQDGLIRSVQGSGSYVNFASLHRQKTGQFAVICTYISEYIFPSILRGIENVTKENGYQLLMYSTNNSIASERAILSNLLGNSPDGIIVEGTKTALPNPNREFYHSLALSGVPIVFINSYYPDIIGENVIYIVTDDYSGGYTAAQTLIREGHQNICGIFKSDDTQGTQRYSGYMDAIVHLGASMRDNNVIWFSTETKELLLHGIGNFLSGIDKSCTAVVCYNDQIAATVLRFFEASSNYAVSAVASFDHALPIGSNTLSFVSYPHPKEKMGRTAAEKLFRMISGHQEDSLVFAWE